ncbi:TlpA family protein disulfide reductase [Pseudoflavitalea sp. G-6-1-2]|uniref:TlpA family protein disulfide reductase n=1 Tax=Pseudoflavitalea sp. G-6-1-2 TaxID=2728841 RepID=UPI001469F975|nr:TlpA disulfide reductase family protein [Pseudoflavitalea sp. G-6-1-2]NML22330.1 TlpA family protein disulfide reductase [Pseudoflavitalea sp. G-6-1-2]
MKSVLRYVMLMGLGLLQQSAHAAPSDPQTVIKARNPKGAMGMQDVMFMKSAGASQLIKLQKVGSAMDFWTENLPAISQIAYVNDLPLLINAGDKIDLDLKRIPFKDGVLDHYVIPDLSKVASRVSLPYRIDSILNISRKKFSTMSFAAFSNWYADRVKQVNQLIKKTAALNESNTALLNAFMQMRKLNLRVAYLDSSKATDLPADTKQWLLEGQDLQNENLALISSEMLLSNYVHQLLQVKGKDEANWSYADQCKWMLQNAKADRLKFLFVSHRVLSEFRFKGITPEFAALYPLIRSSFSDKAAIEHMAQLYGDWQKVLPGKPAKNFALKDDKGNTHQLTDYRGKLVVVDLWATWCGGCVKALPYFLQLADKYKDSTGIVFLNISFDNPDSPEWMDFLKNKKMESYTNLNLPFKNEHEQAIMFRSADYQLIGVPRYMLIDKQGNFHTPYAPSPSEPVFEKLVNEFYQSGK